MGSVVVLVALGIHCWLTTESSDVSSILILEPPAIDLAGIDPDVAKLVKEARTAVNDAPRSAAAWGKLGTVLFVHNYLAQAGVCFAQAERLEPRGARWPYFQGVILAESDPEKAIPRLQRAADLCGDVPDAPRLRLGELLLGQGRLEQAQAQFQRVLQRDRGNARAHLGVGRLAFQKGDLQDSQSHLLLSVADRRTQKACRVLLAQISECLGKKPSAEEYRQIAAMPDDPDWPDPFLDEAVKLQTGKQTLLTRANVLVEKGRLSEAVALSRQLVRDHPDSEMAWLILGKALIQQKDLPAARDALEHVLRVMPDSVEAHFYLGFACYLQRDYRAAAVWYRKATELKPDFTYAYHDLGHCLLRLGDRAGAIEAFRTALRCQPDLPDVHGTLSDLLWKDGRHAEAFAHARLAFQLDPANATAKKHMQRMLLQMSIPVGP